MKTYISLTIAVITSAVCLSACLRLDDNLFNNNEHKIDHYELYNYKGDVDFTLDASYALPDNLVHLFTLNSQGPGETQSTKIYAVYIGDTARIASDTVIMYCHGNKDHMDFYWPRTQLLANTISKNHYGVLMIDYRGYGLSEGTPTESGLYNDVDAALQWLKVKGLTNERLIMYGFSLGTAPAVMLTAIPRSMIPSKLILEAPMASAEAMVQDGSALALPGSFFTNASLNNAGLIRLVQQPFMWMQGIDDHYLSITTEGEVVYDNYNGTYKEAHRIPGADHFNVPVYFPFDKYIEAVGLFIRR